MYVALWRHYQNRDLTSQSTELVQENTGRGRPGYTQDGYNRQRRVRESAVPYTRRLVIALSGPYPARDLTALSTALGEGETARK